MNLSKPLDFSKILRTILPFNDINERAEGHTTTRIFVLNGRHFFHDTFYRENGDTRRILDIYDLYFNRIIFTYDFADVLASLNFKTSIGSSEFLPRSLDDGLVLSGPIIQKLDMEYGLVIRNGRPVQLPNCHEIFGVNFLKRDEELFFVAYRAANNSHSIALFNWFNLNRLACVRAGEDMDNMRIIEVYPKLDEEQTERTLQLMNFRRFEEVDGELKYGCTALEWNVKQSVLQVVNVADSSKWPTSKNIYLSGAWRSHLFICCIHKLDTDNYKETQIHIYNSNAKRWFTPFSPFNGMISLACDVINDENGPLTFCSYTFKTTETRSHVEPLAFLEAFYRLPTRRPETLETLCHFAAINFGIYEARVQTGEHLKQLKVETNMLFKQEEELAQLQSKVENRKLNVQKLKKNPANFKKNDRTHELPNHLSFEIDGYLLMEDEDE